jgi:hypothetical protein
MSNPTDDDPILDDDVYDETLDDNFEDDDDYIDMDLDDDDFDDDDISLDDEDEFIGDEPEWSDENEDAVDESLLKKEKKGIGLSFNAMAIIGALVVGFGVLVFQVMTSEKKVTIDSFRSALNMSGASDGPIFGGNQIETAEIDQVENQSTDEKGFLYEPEELDSMGVNNVEEDPPQPTPISQDGQDSAATTPTLTPDPSMSMENIEAPEPVESANVQTQDPQVPRPPEDINLPEFEEMQAENQQAEASPAQTAADDSAEGNMPKAEDFLKSALENRRQQQREAMNKTDSQMADAAETEAEIMQQPVNNTAEEKKVQQEKTALTDMPEPEQETATPAKPTSGTQERVMNSDLESKLDMIVSRLESMETKIASIENGKEDDIEELNDQLQNLKQEMADIGSRKTTSSASTTEKTTSTAPKAAPKKTTSSSSSSSESKPAPAPVKKKAPSTRNATVTWELRAAQPGKAWVAKKGQNNMQPVIVGDSLAGIGRITAITFDGRRWAVQGTQGRILQ